MEVRLAPAAAMAWQDVGNRSSVTRRSRLVNLHHPALRRGDDRHRRSHFGHQIHAGRGNQVSRRGHSRLRERSCHASCLRAWLRQGPFPVQSRASGSSRMSLDALLSGCNFTCVLSVLKPTCHYVFPLGARGDSWTPKQWSKFGSRWTFTRVSRASAKPSSKSASSVAVTCATMSFCFGRSFEGSGASHSFLSRMHICIAPRSRGVQDCWRLATSAPH